MGQALGIQPLPLRRRLVGQRLRSGHRLGEGQLGDPVCLCDGVFGLPDRLLPDGRRLVLRGGGGLLRLGGRLRDQPVHLLGQLFAGPFALRVESRTRGGGLGYRSLQLTAQLVGVGLGTRPDFAGFLVREPDHPLHAIREVRHGDRLEGAAVELGAQGIGFGLRGGELRAQLGHPLIGRVPVRRGDPQVVFESFQVGGDLLG